MKKGPEFLPKIHEVVLNYHLSRVLRAFCSPHADRPQLNSAFINRKEAVATDGHCLIRMPHERSEIVGAGSWLIHRDAFLLAKRAKDVLVLNIETGHLTVQGEGPTFPLILPKASGARGYPDFEKLFDPEKKPKTAAVVGLNPELVKRAMLAVGKTGRGIVLDIPEHVAGENHVDRGIPFRVLKGDATGLLMPMRVVD